MEETELLREDWEEHHYKEIMSEIGPLPPYERDFPDFLPITEKTRVITRAVAERGIFYAVKLSINMEKQKRLPIIQTFFEGVTRSFGLEYKFQF